MKRLAKLKHSQHHLFLPMVFAVQFLWIVVGPGWPPSWATSVPVIVLAAYTIGWLRGEDHSWRRQLALRERTARRSLALAHILRDPAHEKVTTPAADRLRDQAMWN